MDRPEEKRNSWLLLIIVGVALLSAAAGASFWQMMQARAPETLSLLVLPEPRPMGDFSLVNTAGEAFSRDDLEGKWTLVFFGFTHCPDVCPSTLYDLQQVHQEISQAAAETELLHQVLFISIDPERDTPELLSEYLTFFDPDFLGATGDHEQLLTLTRQLGIAYRIEEHPAGSPQYDVDHSASVLLLDQRGQLYGIFTAPQDAQAMAKDLAAVIYRDS